MVSRTSTAGRPPPPPHAAMKLKETFWPDALPQEDEDKIFSVVCGNTHIQWSIHEGLSSNYSPSCCWRTTHLSDDERKEEAATPVLARHLPAVALKVIFGKNVGNMTKEMARQHSLGRSAVPLTVYIVATNMDQAKRVAWCFSELPCRIFLMKSDDFFSTAQGRYETMGMDRLACMKAVGQFASFPALVIDGGTCLTYTAANADGHLLGGGITLGLLAKFTAIAQNTQYAPGMSASIDNGHDLLERAKEMVAENKPLEHFSKNTKDAVVACALKEIGYHCRQVLKKYLQDIHASSQKANQENTPPAGDSSSSNANGSDAHANGTNNNASTAASETTKEPPTVIVAGGDNPLLTALLDPESNLLEKDPSLPDVKLSTMKHLAAFGVAAVLIQQMKKRKEAPLSELDQILLGCRVAKEFNEADIDGDKIYRGTIAGSIREKSTSTQDSKHYLILYDDGDTEDINLIQLHAALVLYSTVGEKQQPNALSRRVLETLDEKQQRSEQAAKTMEQKNAHVRDASSANRTQSTVTANRSPHLNKNKQQQQQPASSAPTETPASSNKRPVEAAASTTTAAGATTASTVTVSQSPAKKPRVDPESYVNKRIAKYFQGDLFFGMISRYESEAHYWGVDYDDGDEEEFEEAECIRHIELYQEHKDQDPDKRK